MREILTFLKQAADNPSEETDKQEATILRLNIHNATTGLHKEFKLHSAAAIRCIRLLKVTKWSSGTQFADNLSLILRLCYFSKFTTSFHVELELAIWLE